MNKWFVVSDTLDDSPAHIVPFVHLPDAVAYLDALNGLQIQEQTLADWYLVNDQGVPVQVSADLDVTPCPYWLGVPLDVSGWLP